MSLISLPYMAMPPVFGNEPTIMSRCSRLQLYFAGGRGDA
jgi:hypothetical protein